MSLIISDLKVSREQTPIISGVSFTIAPGELHILSGVNGAGKSTLLNALMANPLYEVTAGSIVLDDTDLTSLPTYQRARHGLFLSLQSPPEVPGVPMDDFLRTSIEAITGERPHTLPFERDFQSALGLLRLDPKFAKRSLNEGFSGGEKKRSELLQLLMLKPKYALLDEPDSGLDQGAVGYLIEVITQLRQQGTGILLVTHYNHIITALHPTIVHHLKNGLLA
jgi:Fe-S cluster assembly ATP-binding protein